MLYQMFSKSLHCQKKRGDHVHHFPDHPTIYITSQTMSITSHVYNVLYNVHHLLDNVHHLADHVHHLPDLAHYPPFALFSFGRKSCYGVTHGIGVFTNPLDFDLVQQHLIRTSFGVNGRILTFLTNAMKPFSHTKESKF